MANHQEILKIARQVFDRETEALQSTRETLNAGFVESIELISNCPGKIVSMGIGKSGIVARKIAATLASTGTPAQFIHPVECMHGDMGMIDEKDIALILSNSGESDEIRRLMLFLRNRKICIIAITARPESFLAKNANCIISMVIPEEASALELVPMASTTVQMVIGDAIAAVMMSKRNFNPADFAMFHPAGSLGKRLLLRVSDIMHTADALPAIKTNTDVKFALVEMTTKKMGAVIVIDDERRLLGILTDGDLRRAIQKYENVLSMTVDKVMTRDPITISLNDMAIDALKLMENRPSQISVLPVVDSDGRVQGIIRLHDLVLAGL